MLSSAARELLPPIKISASVQRNGLQERPSLAGTPAYLRKHQENQKRPVRVKSLAAYCIHSLYPSVHRISELEKCWTPRAYGDMRTVVLDLLPHVPKDLLLGISDEAESLGALDAEMVEAARNTIQPQLWALLNALILPSTFPEVLRHMNLALSDPLLPSLQMTTILSTKTISLLTCLSLESTESRLKITDEAMVQLRTLSCLTILGLAATPITSRALRLLMPRRLLADPTAICPRRLRILDLRRTFVDDELLHSKESGQDVTIFPLLCAIDVRGTNISLPALNKFRESWCHDSNLPLNLFHPTPIQSIMDNLSLLLNRGANDAKCEHAFLFIDRLDYPPPVITNTEENRERRQKAQLSMSGVAVFTHTNIILGNVFEDQGTKEEGSAQARFTANRGTSSSQVFKSRKPPVWSSVDRSFTADADGDSGRDFLLYRSPREVVLNSKLPARDPPEGPVTKRKRTANDAYSIKRFKGSATMQIFGSTSLASRRL